jgi:protein-S-isoprenylcysteine O-methyltransferase Ste14
MTALLGFLTPFIIYAVLTTLHYFLPGRWLEGYVSHAETGDKLRYRLNGRLVLLTAMGLWFLLGYLEWVPFDWLYQVRWYSLAGAFVIGLTFSLIMVLPHPSTGKPLVADLFLGRLENPRLQGGRIDAKMWLYLIGAVMLELNVLSFSAHHYLDFGPEASPGIFICAALLTYFVFDYLSFEEVHLYTYDLFAERVGFKLGWGCLTFYPYFYAIALWSTVHLPDPGTASWSRVTCILVFLGGWVLARGANMQKFYFKTQPDKTFLGLKPQTLSGGDKSLLLNGFWGLSRHINYLGEILMALGIALSVGYPGTIWPWLYPLYYVALLFPRQRDDDKRCAKKYGSLWQEYTKKVKYRIIPFVY